MRRSRARIFVAAAATALACAALVPGQAAAADPPELPVPYSVLSGAAAVITEPGADPPGANDWECKPSPARPNPVVLVHPFIVNMTFAWQTTAALLANNGYCVFALNYGTLLPGSAPPLNQLGGFRSMERSAAELDDFVTKVRSATGARNVDLVTYSEGGLMSQHYLRFLGGADEVDKAVGVASPYHGTMGFLSPGLNALKAVRLYEPVNALLSTAGCAFCLEATPDSAYVTRLLAQPGGAAVPGVSYTTITTRYDEVATPYTTGRIDNPAVTNIVVQDGCEIDLSEHAAIMVSRRTNQMVLNALDPANAKPPPCDPVAPLVGGELPRIP